MPKDVEMLANMKIEADNRGQRWGGIFNVAWPSPNWPPDLGNKAAMYAVIPTSSGCQGGLQLADVVPWAQRILQSIPTNYPGVFVVKVRVRARNVGLATLWHLDLPLMLQNLRVEHAFSSFMRANLHCPMDGRENMFVYGTGSGVSWPWQEASMSMLVADLWILGSNLIQRGRVVLRDAPAGSTSISAFAAIATRCIDYQTELPIIPPPWDQAPARQPSPPSQKAVHYTAAQCNLVVKANPPLK